MKIEKVVMKKYSSVKEGDIIESEVSGLFYLIVKSDNGKYRYVILNHNTLSKNEFETVSEACEHITSNTTVIHKSEDVKIVIQ